MQSLGELTIIVPWAEPRDGEKTLNELYPDGLFKLPEAWLRDYYHKEPRWGFNGLGWAVYVRTYSREVEGENRMEDWTDTMRRVTEGNFNIKFTHGQFDKTATLREACRLFHINWHLGLIPPGRSLWMSGSKYMREREGGGDALNNCWGVLTIPMPVRSGEPSKVSTPFRFLIDQAMKGGGVGGNVERQYVAQIPAVKNTVELFIACHNSHPNVDEVEPDFQDAIPADLVDEHTDVYVVDDSRQGWGEALARVIDAHWNGTKRVILDVTGVRPFGKKLTFGGRASGPGPLSKLRKINEIINARYDEDLVAKIISYVPWILDATQQYLAERPLTDAQEDKFRGKLRPIDCADIYQIEGTIVVAGNIRRTAIIIVGSRQDREFVESKQYDKVGWEPSNWRWASNNSVDVGPATSYEYFREEMAPAIYYNGEPGYVNLFLAQNYGRIKDGLKPGCDQFVIIFNPCGEIGLTGGYFDEKTMKWYGGEPCNLYEVSLSNCYTLGFDYVEAVQLAARFSYRVTFTPYEWEMSQNVISRNRRIGVSLTGVTDWCLLAFNSPIVVGVNELGEPAYCQEYMDTLDGMYVAVVEANQAQADGNGTEVSIKDTTVKPSGSVSLVLGNSPGQHYHWGGHMIRRVTAGIDSPIVDAALEAGLPIEPKIIGRNEDGSRNYDLKTAVIEFPTKAPTADHPLFRSAADVPLWEQAMVQESLAYVWADNAVSATLNFHKAPKGDAEAEAKVLDEIARVLYRAKDRIKSTSLLPYFTGEDPDGNPFDQLPYESITKEEYERRVAAMKGPIYSFYKGGVVKDDLDDSAECQGNHCPIR